MKHFLLLSLVALSACSTAGSETTRYDPTATATASVEAAPRPLTYEEQQQLMAETEGRNWQQHLQNALNTRGNLIGEVVVYGELINTASVATFRNVTLNVKFYGAEGEALGETDVPVYDYIRPNSSVTIKKKMMPPTGTVTASVFLTGAEYSL